MFGDFWKHLSNQFWCSFIVSIIICFSYLDTREVSERGFFTEMASAFQGLTVSKRKLHLRCLTVPKCISKFNYDVALLWVLSFIFHLFIFCHFTIPLFYHICFNCFKWDFECYHFEFFFWCWVTLLLTLDNFSYI